MWDKLIRDKNIEARKSTLPNWYIIAILILLPPVGFYLVMKYRSNWLSKHRAFPVAVAAYVIILTCGYFLSKYPANVVMSRNIKTETITQKEAIPYATVTQNSGEAQEGTPGEKEVEYEVKYLDGREIGRVILKETIAKEPLDAVVISPEETVDE